jgi:hypothetical protein
MVCRGYHCTGDPEGAGGWIPAAIAAGEPVCDEIIRRADQTQATLAERRLTVDRDR